MPQQKNIYLSWLLDILGITCIVGVFYTIWLGHHPLFTPDEGRYSEVAREMVASGDYITPRINGVAFLDKPVLYYWLQASAIHMFGLKEWALRLWPAILGVIGCVATFSTGRILYNRHTGWLAAAILATCPLYYGAAHYANLDLEVAVWISLALFVLISGFNLESGKLRSTLFILAWALTALAFLTKGLIALFFPMVISSIWLFCSKKLQLLKIMRIPTGIITFIIIVFPWYFLVEKANPGFLHFFFVTQQVSRFLSHGDFNNQSPAWFYLPIVIAGFLPWSVFFCQTIYKNFSLKQLSKNNGFFIIWTFTVLIFFSLPKSKTIGYILPICPPLALLSANYISSHWRESLKAHKGAFILFLITAWVLLPSITIGLFIQAHRLWPWLSFASIIFIFSGILLSYNYTKNLALAQGFKIFLISSIAFCLLFLASGPTLNNESIKPLAMSIKNNLKPTDEVVVFYKYYQDLPLYLERRITIVEDWQAADIPERDNWVRELWYGMPFQKTDQWLINENTFWQRWHSNKKLIVIMDKNRIKKFHNKADHSIEHQGSYRDTVWVSNK